MANFKTLEGQFHRNVRNLAERLIELEDLRDKVRKAEKATNRRRHVLSTKRMWSRAPTAVALAP